MFLEHTCERSTVLYPHRKGSHPLSLGHPTFSFLVNFIILDLEIPKFLDCFIGFNHLCGVCKILYIKVFSRYGALLNISEMDYQNVCLVENNKKYQMTRRFLNISYNFFLLKVNSIHESPILPYIVKSLLLVPGCLTPR